MSGVVVPALDRERALTHLHGPEGNAPMPRQWNFAGTWPGSSGLDPNQTDGAVFGVKTIDTIFTPGARQPTMLDLLGHQPPPVGPGNDVSLRARYSGFPDDGVFKEGATWTLDDRLMGNNPELTRTVNCSVVSSSSFYTQRLLPWEFVNNRTVHWNVSRMDSPSIVQRLPHEGVSQLITSERKTRSATAVRRGLALTMDDSYFSTPEGALSFARRLQGLVRAITNTVNLGVMEALVECHDEDETHRNGAPVGAGVLEMLESEVFDYAAFQSRPFAMQEIVKTAVDTMRLKGVQPDAVLLPPGSKNYLKFGRPENAGSYESTGYGDAELARCGECDVFEAEFIQVDTSDDERRIGNLQCPLVQRTEVGEIYSGAKTENTTYLYSEDADDFRAVQQDKIDSMRNQCVNPRDLQALAQWATSRWTSACTISPPALAPMWNQPDTFVYRRLDPSGKLTYEAVEMGLLPGTSDITILQPTHLSPMYFSPEQFYRVDSSEGVIETLAAANSSSVFFEAETAATVYIEQSQSYTPPEPWTGFSNIWLHAHELSEDDDGSFASSELYKKYTDVFPGAFDRAKARGLRNIPLFRRPPVAGGDGGGVSESGLDIDRVMTKFQDGFVNDFVADPSRSRTGIYNPNTLKYLNRLVKRASTKQGAPVRGSVHNVYQNTDPTGNDAAADYIATEAQMLTSAALGTAHSLDIVFASSKEAYTERLCTLVRPDRTNILHLLTPDEPAPAVIIGALATVAYLCASTEVSDPQITRIVERHLRFAKGSSFRDELIFPPSLNALAFSESAKEELDMENLGERWNGLLEASGAWDWVTYHGDLSLPNPKPTLTNLGCRTVLYRPHIAHMMGSAVVMKTGPDVGGTMYGAENDFSLTRGGDNILGNMTFYSKSYVKDPKTVTVKRNVTSCAYMGGNSLVPAVLTGSDTAMHGTSGEQSRAGKRARFEGALHAMLLPPLFDTDNLPALMRTRAIDVTGIYPDSIKHALPHHLRGPHLPCGPLNYLRAAGWESYARRKEYVHMRMGCIQTRSTRGEASEGKTIFMPLPPDPTNAPNVCLKSYTEDLDFRWSNKHGGMQGTERNTLLYKGPFNEGLATQTHFSISHQGLGHWKNSVGPGTAAVRAGRPSRLDTRRTFDTAFGYGDAPRGEYDTSLYAPHSQASCRPVHAGATRSVRARNMLVPLPY